MNLCLLFLQLTCGSRMLLSEAAAAPLLIKAHNPAQHSNAPALCCKYRRQKMWKHFPGA